MITAFWTVVVLVAAAVLVLAVGRYGADTRTNDTVDTRDPALPRGPQYHHTPARDLRLLLVLVRRVRAQQQAWAAYDRSLRPWETERSGARPGRWETERSWTAERSGVRPVGSAG